VERVWSGADVDADAGPAAAAAGSVSVAADELGFWSFVVVVAWSDAAGAKSVFASVDAAVDERGGFERGRGESGFV
jgi:hypothetical protein